MENHFYKKTVMRILVPVKHLMKNTHYFITVIMTLLCSSAYAQGGGSSQNGRVSLSEVVSASLFAQDSGNTSSIVIPIGGINALAGGAESHEIEVTLQSTADYDVSVSSTSPYFTYNGPDLNPAPMLVKDVLSIKITANNTGGTVTGGFNDYQPVDGTMNQLVIATGLSGSRTFSFRYMAQPGFNYPAGTYTTDIVYTITKK